MRTQYSLLSILSLLCAAFTSFTHAQTSAFTYQGFLTDGGLPATTEMDFQFMLHRDELLYNPVGIVPAEDVPVTNGVFVVRLDFGAEAFDGDERWLEIWVRPGAGTNDYTALSPRQELTSAPYAVRAGNATAVATGTITDPSFIGMTSSDPLELSINSTPVFRIQSSFSPGGLQPSIVAGHPSNEIDPLVRGSVIAGGGIEGASNAISGDLNTAFNVIGGGVDNHIADSSRAVIAGGSGNRISTNADYSTIAGGYDNEIGVDSHGSFAAGARAKVQHQGTFVWAEILNKDTIGLSSGRYEFEDSSIVNGFIDNATRAYPLDLAFTVDSATQNTRFYGVRLEYTLTQLGP